MLKKKKVGLLSKKPKRESVDQQKAVKAEVVNFKRYLITNIDKAVQDFQKSIMAVLAKEDARGSRSEKLDPPLKHRPPVARPVSSKQPITNSATHHLKLPPLNKCEHAIFEVLNRDATDSFWQTQLKTLIPGPHDYEEIEAAIISLSEWGLIQHNNNGSVSLNRKLVGL